MTLKSRLLHQELFDSQSADIHGISEQQASTLPERHSQLQAEIDTLQEALEQLEVNIVFDPPSKSLSVEERLEIHFQSIKIAKGRAKTREQIKSSLVEKRNQLKQIETQLNQRQIEAGKAMKRLELLATAMKQAEREYAQVFEEFQATAQMTQQILVDAYGQQAGGLFESRLKADVQVLPQHHHSLIPSSNC